MRKIVYVCKSLVMQNVANMSLFQRRLFIEQDIVNWTAIVPLPLPCISNWIILKQRSKRSLDSEASGRQRRLSLYPGGADAPHPKLGGKAFWVFGGGRTKNIDVLMIVMLKLANGFSDYEQVPIGARIVVTLSLGRETEMCTVRMLGWAERAVGHVGALYANIPKSFQKHNLRPTCTEGHQAS